MRSLIVGMITAWTWLRMRWKKRGQPGYYLVCMRQADTWCWPGHLGSQTPGICHDCGEPVYYEVQNALYTKVCSQCAWGLGRPRDPGVLADRDR